MTEQYLCLHGHFYQPPRENPWLNFVELQPSARPFHDWNERITRECYGPNTRARVLGQEGRLAKLVNNFEYMSFNIGPTLIGWLERANPWIYQQIITADRTSRTRNLDHGNALAQVYNHLIMPLANQRDKLTQIRWGLADFEHRFGRKAEGMWLAETAVDSETLKLLAEAGLKFTILSPDQAQKVRTRPSQGPAGPWEDVGGGRIDPRRPYRVFLDGAERIFFDVFFYDGPISRALAYQGLLNSGPALLARIEQAMGEDKDGPRLVNLATDGETYGHHSRFGEMALAWLCDHLEKERPWPRVVNYGAFLELHPPDHEVRIIENSAWSCPHGVERWRSDCGCRVGSPGDWNQAWRTPLRQGLDWLADKLASIFQRRGGRLLKDPWAARDDYISVLLRPTSEAKEEFFGRHQKRDLSKTQKTEVIRLLESQRMSLFMFTSCGWFFDDISGLEPIQNLKYAARAIDLVQEWDKTDLEAGLMTFLRQAKSNDPTYGDGAEIFRTQVLPARMDPSTRAAHFALGQLLARDGLEDCPVTKGARSIKRRRLSAPGLEVLIGEIRIEDDWTGQEAVRGFTALHHGPARLTCLIDEAPGPNLDKMTKEIHPALEEVSPDQVLEIAAGSMKFPRSYNLMDLIPDTRNRLIRHLALDVHTQFMNRIREFYDSHLEVLSLLLDTNEPVPETQGYLFRLVAGDRLLRLLEEGRNGQGLNWAELREVARRMKTLGLNLNEPAAVDLAAACLRREFQALSEEPNPETITNIREFLRLAQDLGLALDLWESQNAFYDLDHRPGFREQRSPEIQNAFKELGGALGFLISA